MIVDSVSDLRDPSHDVDLLVIANATVLDAGPAVCTDMMPTGCLAALLAHRATPAGGDLTSDETAGGSWIAIPGEVVGTSPDAQGRVLIAQLTTDGTVVFDCNIQYSEADGSTPVVTELSIVFQNNCPEDIDGSGLVDIQDILTVLTQFGCSGMCMGDLDGDGSVAISDGLLVLGAFGSFCN